MSSLLMSAFRRKSSALSKKRKREGKKEQMEGERHLTGTRAPRTSQVRQFVSITITICHRTVSVKYGSICSHAATRCISSLTLSVNLLHISNTPSYPLLKCAKSHKEAFTGGHLVSRQAPPTKDPPAPSPPSATCSQSLPSIRME